MGSHQLIDKYFPVLDYGFVALKDFMGSDEDIEQSARVSYGRGTRKISETRNLLRYLMRHKHTSPFEMAEVKFHIGLPIFVARQWIRHRTANVNEYSGRYSIMPSVFYTPQQEHCATQAQNNKQGRSSNSLEDKTYNGFVTATQLLRNKSIKEYEARLEVGMAKELARIDLPLSTYTYWYWKIDLHNLFHFLKLRCDSHAQYEIRVYADTILKIINQLFPLSVEAFVDYSLCASTLSRLDKLFLKDLVENWRDKQHPDTKGCEKVMEQHNLSTRELEEFRNKIIVQAPPNLAIDLSQCKTSEEIEDMINKDEQKTT